ncbi:uncharacterized protein KGF55_005449 [Candida pseudojiufengensis]|uniref:uncharacterized protein n=1 Tax=Candida pseudojiufengensis TaxID=497109 RepID=UPI00222470A4|nr:uncharacterized protein KGF55_005449 [Candida pseudojiufengensis]KAI5959299.1 hypothetical protein KGF55_005449 [Candida pseudojiufengensis]
MPAKDNSQINPQTQWKNINTHNNNNIPNGGQSNHNRNEPTYTLPGVINYLTSEFTHLERFKIITNLEKSEMKYKILHLQGEVDSLKFINKKQQAKINSLEQEIRILKKDPNLKDEEKTETDDSIPEVDLTMIKESRKQLKDTMKEIFTILKAPSSSLEQLNFPNKNENEFDALIDKSDEDFDFTNSSSTNNTSPKSNVISRFFTDENDMSIEEEVASSRNYVNSDDDIDDVLERALSNDSEAGTVIGDNDESEERRENINEPRVEDSKPSINDYVDEEFDNIEVYDNSEYTIYLNFKEADQNAKLTTVSKGNRKVIFSKELSLSMNPKKISNIFALHNESFLLLGDELKVLDFHDKATKSTNLFSTKSNFSEIRSSSLLKFESKSDSKSNIFGLAINGITNGTKLFTSRIYQLTQNITTNQITQKELGTFGKRFLSKNKNVKNITFLGWDKLDIGDSNTDDKSSISSLKSSGDSSLAPYNVLYQVGDQTLSVNLMSKQISYEIETNNTY